MRASLAANGLRPADVCTASGAEVLTGQRSDFRWRWFASRLHTAVVVRRFDDTVPTVDALEHFLGDARRWAVQQHQGAPLGLQVGVAIIAAAVAGDMSAEARAWASTPHGRKYAVITFPVAVDLGARQLAHPRRLVIGGIYSAHLRRLADRVLAAPLRQPE